MRALIRGYNLQLEGPDSRQEARGKGTRTTRKGLKTLQKAAEGVRYVPIWDNWISSEASIKRFVSELRFQLRAGNRPIATIFAPSNR